MPATQEKEQVFQSMQESLAKIEKNTAAMGDFAKTAEDLVEAGRAQKIRDNEQVKQTGFLAGLFKRSKEEKAEKDKDKGFFARHWLKLLLAGLAIFALLKAPISLFADVKDFIEKNMKEILIGLGVIAAGLMAAMTWMGLEALAVYKGLKKLRDLGKGKLDPEKPKKTPKTPKDTKPKIDKLKAKNIKEIKTQTEKWTDAGKTKPTVRQKLSRFWSELGERNLAKEIIVKEAHRNPNFKEIKATAKRIQTTIPGTGPLIDDNMKANVRAAENKARSTPIDRSKRVQLKSELDRPQSWNTSQKILGATQHGTAGGANLPKGGVQKSLDLSLKHAEQTKAKAKKAAKLVEEGAKVAQKGIGKTGGKGSKFLKGLGTFGRLFVPAIMADQFTESYFGVRTNFTHKLFGGEGDLFETGFEKKGFKASSVDAGAEAVAITQDFGFMSNLYNKWTGKWDEPVQSKGMLDTGQEITTYKRTPIHPELTKEKVIKDVFIPIKNKIKNKLMGWVDKIKFKTEDVRKSVAATIAMNPETANLLHISGATMSGMGQNMNVTSAFRTRAQQIDAMEWQRKNKPEDYKANYSLGGTITPSSKSTEQWLSKTSSRHQHGKGFDISWPPEHSKTNAKGKALIASLNNAYRANGVKAFAVPEGNHIHIGSGVQGVSLGMAGPEVEKLYGETLQRLESGTPNTSGTVLQNLNQFTADPHTQMNKGPVVFQDNSTKSANTTTLMPGSATDKGGFWHGVMSVYHGTANWKLQGQGY